MKIPISDQLWPSSILALSVDERIKIAQNATGSRVFDALLESPTVTPKIKRQFVMDFIGHYHILVDDKLGSRVGDRCWAFSDTYLKVCNTFLRADCMRGTSISYIATGKNRPLPC